MQLETNPTMKDHIKNELEVILKKIDSKNPKISEEEIIEEIKAYRKEKRESGQT